MYTVFHSYKDDELIRYALSAIDHPAVQEICSRLNNVSVELDEINDLEEVQKELETAEDSISDLQNEIDDLKSEIRDLNCEVESLTEQVTELEAELA